MTVRMSMSPGTAEAGSDYPEQSLSATFDVGEEEACTTLKVIDDVIPEEQETFEVALQVNEHYNIGNPGYTMILISDEDRKYACMYQDIKFYKLSEWFMTLYNFMHPML